MYVSTRYGFLPDFWKTRRDGKTPPVPRHKPGMTINHLATLGPCCTDGPPVDVVNWRLCRLLESGFAPDLAQLLASTPAVDIHALLELVDRGCPSELAARILSPMEPAQGAP
jgi:hypothetical protein